MNEPDALAAPVYIDGAYKPFGELTLAEVEARAQELRAATGFGPTARVGSVARAWAELARAMTGGSASTVAQLEPGTAAELARRAWVIPPGGSLI